MKRIVALVLMLCVCAPPLRAQVVDTVQRRPSAGAEVAGGILGSVAGLAAGGLLGLTVESSSGCANDVCGGGALVGAAIGGTLGAASGAYVAGKAAGHEVSFVRALGGATLGLLIFGGLAAAIASSDVELALPFALTIPIGQGWFAGGAARWQPRQQ